jgi:hypothetical protein
MPHVSAQGAPWDGLQSIERADVATAVGLFSLGILTRAPFVGRILYHWDSINFALALQEFDVARGQPHIPGYPLYVMLGRAIGLLGGDAQSTLVGISVVSSGLAVACMYWLGRDLHNRRLGLVTALLLATSPLFWFYGLLALPHSLDALVVILCAWLLLRLGRGDHRLALPAAIALGIAGGLRPQTQVFLLPLALYAAKDLSWKRKGVAVLGLAVTDVAWFVPLVIWSGGPSTYFNILWQFYRSFTDATSVVSGAGLAGLSRNLLKLGMYTAYGWAAAMLPFVIAPALRVLLRRPFRSSFLSERWAAGFLLAWVLPVLVYYSFIHMGQQGLIFVFLPAFLLTSAATLDMLGWLDLRRAGSWLLALMIAVNAVVFLLMPTFPLGTRGPKLLTISTLRAHDESYESRFAEVRTRLDPAHAVILSDGWRFPQYYLPEYPLLRYGLAGRWEQDRGQPVLGETARVDPMTLGLKEDSSGFIYLVIFDPQIESFNGSTDRIASRELAGSGELTVLWMKAGEMLELSPQSFRIVNP